MLIKAKGSFYLLDMNLIVITIICLYLALIHIFVNFVGSTEKLDNAFFKMS